MASSTIVAISIGFVVWVVISLLDGPSWAGFLAFVVVSMLVLIFYGLPNKP